MGGSYKCTIQKFDGGFCTINLEPFVLKGSGRCTLYRWGGVNLNSKDQRLLMKFSALVDKLAMESKTRDEFLLKLEDHISK